MKAVLAVVFTRRGAKIRGGRRRRVLIDEGVSVGLRLRRRRARRRGDEGRQSGAYRIEIDARLLLPSRAGLKPLLLIAKAVAALSMRTIAAIALALLTEAPVVAGLAVLAFLALATGLGSAFRISFLAFRPVVPPFALIAVERRTIEIGLRLAAISHLTAIWLRLLKRRSLRGALQRRSETVGQGDEIVVLVSFVEFLAVPAIAHLRLLLRGLRGGDHPEIVLGVLQQIFGSYGIAGRLGVARELQIFLGDVLGRATNFYVRAVGFISPRQRVRAFSIVATTHALVLTRSH